MEHKVLTPEIILIPSFNLRGMNGESGVIKNISWSVDQYNEALEALHIPNARIMWEATRHQFPAQASLDASHVDTVDTQKLALFHGLKENSRGETSVSEVLFSRRSVFNVVYALMQEHKYSASASKSAVHTYSLLQASHPGEMIPVRVEVPRDGAGLATESLIPNKILAVRMEDVLKSTQVSKTASLPRLVSRLQEIQDEHDVVGLELNVRDIFGNLPEILSLQLIEQLIHANQISAPEVALIQMITYETMRMDLPSKLEQETQNQALKLIGSEFKGSVMVSPGAGQLHETLDTVIRHHRT